MATSALSMSHLRAAPAEGAGEQFRADGWKTLDNTAAIAAWDRLAHDPTEPNPFLESWYLLPALRAFDPHGSVQLLRVERHGALIGLLPLARCPRYYRWPIPHLAGWNHANAFVGAPLVARGAERAFWNALLNWADRNGDSALFLHLTELPLSGPLHAALIAVCADQNRRAALVHREDRALLHSELAGEGYFEAALSGKKRKELRRQHTRLSELGKLAVERSRDADGVDAWADAFLALERSGWKGSAGSAMASDPRTAALLRESLRGAAQRGKLERLALTLDGAPIAMLATFLTPPGAFSYKTAFDERFARFSPGVLLQRENLALLDDPALSWCDSCAAANHPMIDHLWRERRAMGRVSIAIGGRVRRALFGAVASAETRRLPNSLEDRT